MICGFIFPFFLGIPGVFIFSFRLVQIFWVPEAIRGWTAAAGEVLGLEDAAGTWNEADLSGGNVDGTA